MHASALAKSLSHDSVRASSRQAHCTVALDDFHAVASKRFGDVGAKWLSVFTVCVCNQHSVLTVCVVHCALKESGKTDVVTTP